MTDSQRFALVLTAGVFGMVLIGPFVSQRDRVPAAKSQQEVDKTPVLAVQSPKEAAEPAPDVARIFDGVKEEQAAKQTLDEFDVWLAALKAGRVRLSGRDFQEEVSDLLAQMREAGATAVQIGACLERLQTMGAQKFAEADLRWLEEKIRLERSMTSFAGERSIH